MYITGQDIQDRIGSDAYTVLLGDYGVAQSQEGLNRLNQALEDAQGEIDGYIAQRYPSEVPLAEPSAAIRRIAVDITIYRLAQNGGWTEDRRQRYEDAVNFLKGIAKGEISLGIAIVDADQTDTSNDSIEISSQSRKFSRNNQVF